MGKSKFSFGLAYIETNSAIHRLSGFTKLLLFLWWILLVFTTFDLRVLIGFLVAGYILLSMARIPSRTYRPFVFFLVYLIALNTVIIYLFAPLQGSKFIGSHTELFSFTEHYVVTLETLVYLSVVDVKFLCIFPIALLFVFTTHPTEFAAALNRVGVSYKISYAFSLTLRYLPEITEDFRNILHSQQARGVDISKKTKLFRRIRNVAVILFPLILSSLEKAEVITNALTLRGFGKLPKRTWYSGRPLGRGDWAVFVLMFLWTIAHFYIRSTVSGMIWYPF